MKRLIALLFLIIPLKSYAIGCIGEWPNEICPPGTTSQASAHTSGEEINKDLVTAFYEMALNQHRPQEAANMYIGAKYIQHNPSIADGKQAFVDFVVDRVRKFPNLHAEIKRIFADKDIVILHVHSKTDENDRGRAIVDLFRIEAGKIVEHWDVIQAVPETSANPNGMF
jgi:predicted SnoaL-like aldol condensation-catalyzing enzyme